MRAGRCCVGLVFGDELSFLHRVRTPGLDARRVQQRLLVFADCALQFDSIGDEPCCHGRVERVSGAKFTKQKRAFCRTPDRADARDIFRHAVVHPFAWVAAADIHRHRPPECAEARVEFGAKRPRPCARLCIGRPYAGGGEKFVQPLGDGERVPGRKSGTGFALPENRHHARGRQPADIVVPVLRMELHQPFPERKIQPAQQHPWAHRP